MRDHGRLPNRKKTIKPDDKGEKREAYQERINHWGGFEDLDQVQLSGFANRLHKNLFL
jgi:hypothetical protein